MSQYLRDSYRRRRQQEQMMFQRIAAEESQIQNFLLLQQANGENIFIGGEQSTPGTSYDIGLNFSYSGPTGNVNFINQTLEQVKQSVLFAASEGYNLNGQVFNSTVPIIIGTQLYDFYGIMLTTSGNYVNTTFHPISTIREVYTITNGIVSVITDFIDIP